MDYYVAVGICITGASSGQVCELNTTCHTAIDQNASTCLCQPGISKENPCVLKGILLIRDWGDFLGISYI